MHTILGANGVIARELSRSLSTSVDRIRQVSRNPRRVNGLKENREMMYQFEHDYRFDSSKIEAAYGLVPAPYRIGITACLGSRGADGA